MGEMMVEIEIPESLYEENYEKLFAEGGSADHIFLRQGNQSALDQSRRTDIEDTFVRFRGAVANILSMAGVETSEAIDRMTMFVAFEERMGFESGIKFVHENAVVMSREEADRRSSVMRNFKTAGL